jgi:hypothetical protein
LDQKFPSQEQNSLESLLPPKGHTDALVSFYLENLELIHRVVHIPTFRREYGTFWIPGLSRSPAMAALVLSMISISCGLTNGGAIQNALTDGLHCEPPLTSDSPYMREMKRRVWEVLRELDLQNSLEYGLPTLLHNIDDNVTAPANLTDEGFDETSRVLPVSKPPNQYTRTAYQYQSSCSWKLRLEISRRLFSPRLSEALTYEDVLRYTHEFIQLIHSLPS